MYESAYIAIQTCSAEDLHLSRIWQLDTFSIQTHPNDNHGTDLFDLLHVLVLRLFQARPAVRQQVLHHEGTVPRGRHVQSRAPATVPHAQEVVLPACALLREVLCQELQARE